MKPWLDDGDVQLHHGDCIQVMRGMPEASVDAVCTDPPYALSFMGRDWDSHATPLAFQAWCQTWAAEALRVLKPGGHLLAFGGTRTSHRLASGIEDAGFEIRDTLCWLYGSGFPKSLDVSKAIDKAAGAEREVIGERDRYLDGHTRQNLGDRNEVYGTGLTANGLADITAPATEAAARWEGWGTALKPAYEPVILARRPLAGTVAATVLAHGTGALNIDATRIEMSDDDRAKIDEATWVARGLDRKAYGDYATDGTDQPMRSHAAGRWPANVLLDEQAAEMLDAETGELHRCDAYERSGAAPTGIYEGHIGRAESGSTVNAYGDRGGASRFFYTAKASRSERNTGLHHLPAQENVGVRYTTMAGDGRENPEVKPVTRQNHHPTVKPVALMRWLCRLACPPGGLVLDPFVGSGSTAVAARAEGFRCIGVDQDAEYLAIAAGRLSQLSLFADGVEAD